MTIQRTENVNIAGFQTLITPEEIKNQLPLEGETLANVINNRQVIRDILDRKDHRMFLVVGPCSIHDPAAAREYAARRGRL